MQQRPDSILRLAGLLFVSVLASLAGTIAVVGQERSQHSTDRPPAVQSVDPEVALTRLIEGNRRFSRNQPLHPHASAQRRVSLGLTGQHPFAIILSCADSRVPPENIFDAGLGDLFVVRVAGHVVDDAVIGSIEYASQHLGARLLVVLGHEKCGAVQAAIDNVREAHLRYLVEAIQPAVVQVRNNAPTNDPRGFADRVVWANVFEAMASLESSEPVLRQLVTRQQLKLKGAVYHLETGKAEFLR
ncbi:MAG: carbonic anhydrase [Acidobacteriota bacterium]